MVMNFDRLSRNVVAIINEVLKNQKLVNYLATNGDNPSSLSLSPANIAPNSPNEKIFPYPFNIKFKDDVRSQLHIYYPNLLLENNGKAGRAFINFDVVVHKDIWLLTDEGEKVIRPYKIAQFILDSFKDKKVDELGEIHFVRIDHVVVNEEFEGVRLLATTTEF